MIEPKRDLEELLQVWLDARNGSRNTRRAYRAAVRAFFQSCDVDPDEVTGSHVAAWQKGMQARGLAESTINSRLAALSSFYAFHCDERDVPLVAQNPVRAVERASVHPYGASTYLDLDEVRALLGVIDREMVTGARDYALIVAYLYTGCRPYQVRRLRWGDLGFEGGLAYYTLTLQDGTREMAELPLPAYRAIVDYLQAAGRLEAIQPHDYVFTALTDVATRLPGVSEMPDGKPLTSAFINHVVKKHARRAGLKWRLIRTSTLRHTAAMLRKDLSHDLRELQRFLRQPSVEATGRYVGRLERRLDTRWTQVEAMIGS